MRPRLLILAAALALACVAPSGAGAARPDQPFARPGVGINPSRDTYSVPEAPRSPDCDTNFCVHWVDEGIDAPSRKDSDADGVPDFVERVLAVADHVHHVENEKLGWREPLSDGALGGGHGKTDIYLTELGGEQLRHARPSGVRRRRDRGRSATPPPTAANAVPTAPGRSACTATWSSTTITTTSNSPTPNRGTTSR